GGLTACRGARRPGPPGAGGARAGAGRSRLRDRGRDPRPARRGRHHRRGLLRRRPLDARALTRRARPRPPDPPTDRYPDMAGNSQRRGATRKPGSKKGATVGSGGRGRKALEGKGPTPKAEERTYHPAYQRKVAAE